MRAGCFVFQGQRVVSRTFAALTPALRFACGPPASVPRVARSSTTTLCPWKTKQLIYNFSKLFLKNACRYRINVYLCNTENKTDD